MLAVVDVFVRTWSGPLALVSPLYSGAYASPDDNQPLFATDTVGACCVTGSSSSAAVVPVNQ
jgi:hypothetical protein